MFGILSTIMLPRRMKESHNEILFLPSFLRIFVNFHAIIRAPVSVRCNEPLLYSCLVCSVSKQEIFNKNKSFICRHGSFFLMNRYSSLLQKDFHTISQTLCISFLLMRKAMLRFPFVSVKYYIFTGAEGAFYWIKPCGPAIK